MRPLVRVGVWILIVCVWVCGCVGDLSGARECNPSHNALSCALLL